MMKRIKRRLSLRRQRIATGFTQISTTSIVSWLLTFCYMLGLSYFVTGPFFRISKGTCQTNTQEECPDYIVPELNKYTHELIYLVQSDEIAKKLSLNLPLAKEVIVESIWPNKLQAKIIWQDAVANISVPATTSALLVSGTGEIMKSLSTPDPTLPIVSASSAADLIISDHLTDVSLQTALAIIIKLHELSLMVTTVNVISPNEIWVDLTNGKRVIFTSLKSVDSQVHALQLILDQATINPELSVIDVRLDRPALKPIQ